MSDYLFPDRENKEKANQVREITKEQITYLLRDNKREKREGEKMTTSSYLGENYVDDKRYGTYGLYKDYIERDNRTAGLQIYYPHGIVIQQPKRRNYYRGENAIYLSSVPSLVRRLRQYQTREEQELYRLVADMRIYEFKCLLDRFEQTNYWKKTYGDVLYDVLAQHYGLETCWLDVTSDFEVALFFANCYYKDGEWHPLTNQQTEIDTNDGIDHRYGMIFHMPSYVESSRMTNEIRYQYSTITNKIIGKTKSGECKYKIREHPEYHGQPGNIILPVGFQPFERCAAQNAYAIYMRNERPLQEDIGFEKLKFRHNEELANWIYDKMDGGKKIYPYEGLSECGFIIDQISRLTDFSEEALEYAVYRSHYFKYKNIGGVRNRLGSFTVDGKTIKIINRHPWKLSAGRRKKIDYNYKDFCLENWYSGVHKITRKTFPGPNPVFEPWMLMTDEDEPGVEDFKLRDKINCTFSFESQDGMRILKTFMDNKVQDF